MRNAQTEETTQGCRLSKQKGRKEFMFVGLNLRASARAISAIGSEKYVLLHSFLVGYVLNLLHNSMSFIPKGVFQPSKGRDLQKVSRGSCTQTPILLCAHVPLSLFCLDQPWQTFAIVQQFKNIKAMMYI